MKPSFVWAQALVLSLIFLPPGLGQRTLADCLPSVSWGLVSFEGIDACAQAAESLNLIDIWKKPEIQAKLKPLIARYLSPKGELPPDVTLIADLVRNHLSGTISAAATKMTVIYGRFGEPIPIPGVVVGIDLAKDVEGGAKAIAKLINLIARENSDVKVQDGELDGLEVSHVDFQIDSSRLSATCGLIDNLFVITLGDAVFREVLATVRSKESRSLASLPSFVEARQAVHGSRSFEAFLNIASARDRLADFVPLEWRAIAQNLGLGAIDSLYAASSVHAKEGELLIWTGAKAPRRGLLQLSQDGALSAHAQRLSSASSVFSMASKVPAKELFDLAESAVLPHLPAREAKVVARFLKQIKQGATNVAPDLLEVIGDELVVSAELGRLTPVPAVVASFGLRNQARAEEIFKKGMESAAIEVKTVDFEGTALHMVDISQFMPDAPIEIKFQPTICFYDSHLMVGLTRINLQNALKRLKDPNSKSFANPEAFTRGFPGMTSDQPSFWIYTDAAKGIERAWTYIESQVMRGLDEALMGSGVSARELPIEEIIASLPPLAISGSGTPHGVALRVRAPLLTALPALASYYFKNFEGNPLAPLLMVGVHHATEYPASAVGHAAPAPEEGSNQPINPLTPGDPAEDSFRRRLAEIEQAIEHAPAGAAVALRYQRANLLHRLRQFEPAFLDFKAAVEGGHASETAAYNAACCLSLLGRADEALTWLERAKKEGFRNRELAAKDSDLDPLRQDERFSAWLSSLRR